MIQLAAAIPAQRSPYHGGRDVMPQPSSGGTEDSIEAVGEGEKEGGQALNSTHRAAASSEQQLSPEQQREVQQL